MRAILALLVSLFLFTSVQAQIDALVAGPIVGYVSSTSAKIWIAAEGNEIKNEVYLLDESGSHTSAINLKSSKKVDNVAAVTFEFENLKAGKQYSVIVNHDSYQDILTLTTPGVEPAEDFSFMTGSCAFMGKNIAKAVMPGPSIKILNSMQAHEEAEFMLWLGDNVYYIGKDYSSYDDMFRRQLRTRSESKLMHSFLQSMPQIAIWDDHDYGPNNAEGDFELKEEALEIFQSFWPNPDVNDLDFEGTTTYFEQGDAAFYMIDCRYHKYTQKEEDTTKLHQMIGSEQLDWLMLKLFNSKATFHFIAFGSQVLNEKGDSESWRQFDHERKELLQFIEEHNIKNVIFLTGDRHLTELQYRKLENGSMIYDYTCSPILSTPNPAVSGPELNNTDSRVENTLVIQRNYGVVTISGEADKRTCTIETYNVNGKILWRYVIEAE